MADIKFRDISIRPDMHTMDGTTIAWKVSASEGWSIGANAHMELLVMSGTDEGKELAQAVETINGILNRNLRERLDG